MHSAVQIVHSVHPILFGIGLNLPIQKRIVYPRQYGKRVVSVDDSPPVIRTSPERIPDQPRSQAILRQTISCSHFFLRRSWSHLELRSQLAESAQAPEITEVYYRTRLPDRARRNIEGHQGPSRAGADYDPRRCFHVLCARLGREGLLPRHEWQDCIFRSFRRARASLGHES